MKKNSQYVGVDEKYIPEDEKYVDDDINNELKEIVNDGIKYTKNYLSDKDNQKKIKNSGKKIFNIFKGIGIGYLIFVGFIFLFIILIFIIVISNFFNINNKVNDNFDNDNSIIEETKDDVYTQYDILSFNGDLEPYKGTKNGNNVNLLLDNVISKIQKNLDHIINVNFNSTSYTTVNDIITLKKIVDKNKNYEVYFGYDSNGFINEVNIIGD